MILPVRGRSAIEEFYGTHVPSHSRLHASVEARLVVGKLVSGHEFLAGISARAVATYEAEDGQIRRAWLFGPLSA
jgi:hypothetical protein